VSAVVLSPVSAEVHRSIEDALDPAGLLNPGTVLPRLPR
jgi:FAD/FMN-containing dehydrogenase